MFSESRKIIFASRRASCFASEHPCPRPEPSWWMTLTIGAVTLISWRALESESILRQRAICISSRAVAIAACVFSVGRGGALFLNLLEQTRELLWLCRGRLPRQRN